jgi:hypothetical protein
MIAFSSKRNELIRTGRGFRVYQAGFVVDMSYLHGSLADRAEQSPCTRTALERVVSKTTRLSPGREYKYII